MTEQPDGQRRADLPGEHQQREVPGQHEADDPDRLAHDKRKRARSRPAPCCRRSCRSARRASGWCGSCPARRPSGTRGSACRCRGSRAPRARGGSPPSASRASAAPPCALPVRASRQRPSSKAAFALATAKSTSSASQAATSASVLPVAGFTVGKVLPEAAGRKAPSMKALPEKLSVSAIAAYSAAVRRSCHWFAPEVIWATVRFSVVTTVSRPRLSSALSGLSGARSVPGLQAGQLAAVLDRLHELAAVEEVHQRHHRRHDPPALVEVLLDDAGLVEGDVLRRARSSTRRRPSSAHPRRRTPAPGRPSRS